MGPHRQRGLQIGAGIALLLIVISLPWVVPAHAQGGFALSGSFYTQNFELPQGATLQAPDVYIVVFNQSTGDFNVRLTPKTPLGVKVMLPEQEFVLKAREQKKVTVGLEVTREAAPGHYEVGVTAEAYIGGEKLASESFDVKAGEEKHITLIVKTIYFENFGLVANYLTGTKDMAFAQLVYMIRRHSCDGLSRSIAKAGSRFAFPSFSCTIQRWR